MHRKHFEQIAATFAAKLTPPYPQDPIRTAVLKDVAQGLCRTFKDINPAFNEARFLAACGFKEEGL